MSLFAAARAGAPLSPGARTFLRALESIMAAALITFLTVLPQLVAGKDWAHVDWLGLLAALGVAILMSASKWFKANGEPMLGDAAQAAATELRQVAGIPADIVIEPSDYAPVAEAETTV